MLEEYRLEDVRIGRFDNKVATLLLFNAGALVVMERVEILVVAVLVLIAVAIAVVSGLYALFPSRHFRALNIDRLLDPDVILTNSSSVAHGIAEALKEAIYASRETMRARETAVRICVWSTGSGVLTALLGFAITKVG